MNFKYALIFSLTILIALAFLLYRNNQNLKTKILEKDYHISKSSMKIDSLSKGLEKCRVREEIMRQEDSYHLRKIDKLLNRIKKIREERMSIKEQKQELKELVEAYTP